MKTIILFTFSILILISCSQKEKNQIKKSIISGQVSNFEKVSEHDIIEFIYEDILAGQIKLAENIDKNGRFKFVLDLDFPTEFYLKYSGLLTYHISPGDSLHFDINGDCWSKTSETNAEEYNFYKVSGTSEKMNNDVAKYTAFFIDSLSNWSIHDSMINNSTPNEYKTFLEELTKKRFEIVENFNRTNNTCKEFQEWVNMKLEFGM